jgi:hypothetical protein
METRLSDARDSPVNEAGFANAGKSGQYRLMRPFFEISNAQLRNFSGPAMRVRLASKNL